MISRIIISFPIPVELGENEQKLGSLVDQICKANRPMGQQFWASEFGNMITSMPITKEDEQNEVPLEFNKETFYIGCAIRKSYKGEYGGECNKTGCDKRPALYRHSKTRKHFCQECADDINNKSESELCKLKG